MAEAVPALGAGTLLAVHAHPDDETLSTGGLLAAWAASGGRVVVVTCTRGERGETIGDDLAGLEGDGEALAELRVAEWRQALAALGVARGVFLDEARRPAWPWRMGRGRRWQDSGMAWGPGGPASGRAVADPAASALALTRQPLADQATALLRIMREERPALVVTYQADGGYGHPDHVRAHEIVCEAFRLLPSLDSLLASVAAPPWRRSRASQATPAVPALWWRGTPRGLASAVAEHVDRLVDDGRIALLSDAVGHRATVVRPASVDRADSGADALGRGDGGPRPETLVRVSTAGVLPQVLTALRCYRSQVQAVRVLDPPVPVPIPERSAGLDAGTIDLVATHALSNGVLAGVMDSEWYLPVESPTFLGAAHSSVR